LIGELKTSVVATIKSLSLALVKVQDEALLPVLGNITATTTTTTTYTHKIINVVKCVLRIVQTIRIDPRTLLKETRPRTGLTRGQFKLTSIGTIDANKQTCQLTCARWVRPASEYQTV